MGTWAKRVGLGDDAAGGARVRLGWDRNFERVIPFLIIPEAVSLRLAGKGS